MKRSLFALAAIMLSLSAVAQEVKQDKPEFTVVKQAPVTSVKNQYRSGTCWCYSALSFVESEIIRQKGIEVDLSEMFVVNHAYFDRAVKYIRLDGKLGFSAGSSFGDVFEVIKSYGIVPQDVYSGMNYGTELPVQGELDAVLEGFVKALVTNPNRKLTPAWKPAFQGILDAYLGEIPATFKAEEKAFNPLTYRDYLGINTDDYINLTSFTHHPFYSWFQLEVCDNWRWDSVYNVPIDEFMEILDNALANGYTAAWGADVSEPGFTRNGLAILVDVAASNNTGSDQERWVGKADDKKAAASKKKESKKKEVNNIVEKPVSQESRQLQFDNKTITDDHGMQIFGIARDQWGNKYYMVKNSWGKAGKYEGIWYASEAFVKAQSMDIIIHRSALPEGYAEKHPNIIR